MVEQIITKPKLKDCHWSWERDDGERNTLAYYTGKDH
jgi:hypothetical protein